MKSKIERTIDENYNFFLEQQAKNVERAKTILTEAFETMKKEKLSTWAMWLETDRLGAFLMFDLLEGVPKGSLRDLMAVFIERANEDVTRDVLQTSKGMT